jgi:hypothetical protein
MQYWICETFRQGEALTPFQLKSIDAIVRFLKYAGRLPANFDLKCHGKRLPCDDSVLQSDALHCGFVVLWRLINFARWGDFEKVCETYQLTG